MYWFSSIKKTNICPRAFVDHQFLTFRHEFMAIRPTKIKAAHLLISIVNPSNKTIHKPKSDFRLKKGYMSKV